MGDPPESWPDRETLARESEVEFVRASGPGGQHRNRRETGVRVRHEPTGIVVTATERRSQARNLEVAFERLAQEIVERRRTPEPRKETRIPRREKARRRQQKRQRGLVKSLRKPPDVPRD